MITYKSSLFIIIKNIIYGIFGGGLAGLIASWFLELNISIIIGAVICFLICYFALVNDNIKLKIDGNDFYVYRLGKLKYHYKLDKVSLSAKIKTVDGDSDCILIVTEEGGGQTHIDCSMLGYSRFDRLLDTLGVTDPEPVEVKTTVKIKK